LLYFWRFFEKKTQEFLTGKTCCKIEKNCVKATLQRI